MTRAGVGEKRGVDVVANFALVAAHRNVLGRQQEHLAGHPLDAAVERFGKSAAEIDQSTRFGIRHLRDVDDDRHAVTEVLGDDLHVFERARVHREDLVHLGRWA